MSRRDKKPLAKGRGGPSDRPRGARPYAEKARTERGKGKPAIGEAGAGRQALRFACGCRTPSRGGKAGRRDATSRGRRTRRKLRRCRPKCRPSTVTADEANMRVDRFLEARFPGLSYSHIQRIVRKGELRVDGKRADSKDRLKAGQSGPHSAAASGRAEEDRQA